MKNFKKLSREELKNTFGGKKACTLTVRNPNGTYTTYSGTCSTELVTGGLGSGEVGIPVTQSFCDIGNGVAYPLSSNGGNSRC